MRNTPTTPNTIVLCAKPAQEMLPRDNPDAVRVERLAPPLMQADHWCHPDAEVVAHLRSLPLRLFVALILRLLGIARHRLATG